MAQEIIQFHQTFYDVHVFGFTMHQEVAQAGKQILKLMPNLLPSAAFPYPPTALNQAQAWLREATDEDINGYANVAAAAGKLQGAQLASIAQEVRSASVTRARRTAQELATGGNQTSYVPTAQPTARRPYSHPYYWAGFIYTGQ